MSRLIFVTTELHPENAGGAGVVVDALARRLSLDRDCVVLLLTSQPVTPQDRPGVEVVNRVIPESGFMKRSEAAARAVADLAEAGDRVEFQDFEGIAYLTLAHRVDLGLDRILMTVRFHGPYDLLAEAMDTTPPDWEIPAAMEREVFRMADAVLIPVEGHREPLVERYDLEPNRMVLAPPPVPDLVPLPRQPRTPPTFAVIGRLGEMKGSQDLVAAALTLLGEGRSLVVRFIGGDGWSTTNSSTMTEWLSSMIGPDHSEAFRFITDARRTDLPRLIADATAVVVPSRFESFCLAAHEGRMMGQPVVVPALPAFTGLFAPETGALVYDGSVEGLVDAMRRLIDDPVLALRLASAPPPMPGSPDDAYRADPEPRHPRAQAGLATGATQRIDALWRASSARAKTPFLQSLYRHLPDGVARLLQRAPQGLKDRARHYGSWPAEMERRAHVARIEALASRLAAGEFPEVPDPDVSIVVPVYNDVRYLEETLASVYEQTHDSWEIVLVDDGSTEPGAIEVLDSLAARPRLRLIRQENTGLPGARNTGMRSARGRFLVPLDADDQLEPNFLVTTIEALDAHAEAGYAHGYARLHHDVDAVFVTRPFNPYWQLLSNGIAQCALIRREAWAAVGGYDESMVKGHEDWEFWVRLMEARWGQVQVREVLYRYRKHGISMSVDAEARFEQARTMIRDRHPALYDRERMRRLKRRWYPLVTLVTDLADPGVEDLEVVSDAEALGSSWGKFVVDLRGVPEIPVELVRRMAEALESDPKAARAVTSGLPPVVMTRRWNLHDPGATPDRVLVMDDPMVGPEAVIPALLFRPGWAVPKTILDMGLPVQHQPPEEDGHLPDPASW